MLEVQADHSREVRFKHDVEKVTATWSGISRPKSGKVCNLTRLSWKVEYWGYLLKGNWKAFTHLNIETKNYQNLKIWCHSTNLCWINRKCATRISRNALHMTEKAHVHILCDFLEQDLRNWLYHLGMLTTHVPLYSLNVTWSLDPWFMFFLMNCTDVLVSL